MTTQTHTGGYLKKMAQGGHFKQKLGETALALTECWCKADFGNRARMGDHLAEQMQHILHQVYGWSPKEASDHAAALRAAFMQTKEDV